MGTSPGCATCATGTQVAQWQTLRARLATSLASATRDFGRFAGSIAGFADRPSLPKSPEYTEMASIEKRLRLIEQSPSPTA